MIDEAPDVVVVLSPDREAHILFANGACARVIEREPEDLVSKPLWELLHPEVGASSVDRLVGRSVAGMELCRWSVDWRGVAWTPSYA
jgi:PAS domain-containing protein